VFDFVLPLEAFSRQFEHIGNYQHHRKADHEHQQDDLEDPVGDAEVWQDHVDDLEDEPCYDNVGDASTKDVTTLKFFEKRHGLDIVPHVVIMRSSPIALHHMAEWQQRHWYKFHVLYGDRKANDCQCKEQCENQVHDGKF